MNRIQKITALFSAAAFACLMLVTTSATAKGGRSGNDGDGTGLRQLVTCSVSNGNHVVQIGNTCDGTGSGCIPNPCG